MIAWNKMQISGLSVSFGDDGYSIRAGGKTFAVSGILAIEVRTLQPAWTRYVHFLDHSPFLTNLSDGYLRRIERDYKFPADLLSKIINAVEDAQSKALKIGIYK